MHPFGGSNDSVYRASPDAKRATDTPALVNQCCRAWLLRSIPGVQRFDGVPEQCRKLCYPGRAAGRTLIDVCVPGSYCLGIRPARGVTALRALRLRKQGVDLVNQVRSHREPDIRSRMFQAAAARR
jgi:hypothetical protein